LSDFHFLKNLFGTVVIPPTVYNEVVVHGAGFPVKREAEIAVGGWLSVRAVQNQQHVKEVCNVGILDLGEAEAIIFAQESEAVQVLLDDQRAVRYARGLAVIRTPLIYGEAKLRGWIPSVREKLDALRKRGFRLKDEHYRLVLAKLGEL
jgi:predicted nucleic acid-binding protein